MGYESSGHRGPRHRRVWNQNCGKFAFFSCKSFSHKFDVGEGMDIQLGANKSVSGNINRDGKIWSQG